MRPAGVEPTTFGFGGQRSFERAMWRIATVRNTTTIGCFAEGISGPYCSACDECEVVAAGPYRKRSPIYAEARLCSNCQERMPRSFRRRPAPWITRTDGGSALPTPGAPAPGIRNILQHRPPASGPTESHHWRHISVASWLWPAHPWRSRMRDPFGRVAATLSPDSGVSLTMIA